jgi:hypothetical protein
MTQRRAATVHSRVQPALALTEETGANPRGSRTTRSAPDRARIAHAAPNRQGSRRTQRARRQTGTAATQRTLAPHPCRLLPLARPATPARPAKRLGSPHQGASRHAVRLATHGAPLQLARPARVQHAGRQTARPALPGRLAPRGYGQPHPARPTSSWHGQPHPARVKLARAATSSSGQAGTAVTSSPRHADTASHIRNASATPSAHNATTRPATPWASRPKRAQPTARPKRPAFRP